MKDPVWMGLGAMMLLMAVSPSRALAQEDGKTAAGLPAEGTVDLFLGEKPLKIQQVFKKGRFPNVVCGVEGTVLAFQNGVLVRRSEDGAKRGGRNHGGQGVHGRGGDRQRVQRRNPGVR